MSRKSDLFRDRRRALPDLTVATIITSVAAAFDVSETEIRSARRDQAFVLPRHAAMWLARRVRGESYPTIGRAFGRRDHTTVIYAVIKTEQRMQDDQEFGEKILGLARTLNGLT